jgi:hypothetical protein
VTHIYQEEQQTQSSHGRVLPQRLGVFPVDCYQCALFGQIKNENFLNFECVYVIAFCFRNVKFSSYHSQTCELSELLCNTLGDVEILWSLSPNLNDKLFAYREVPRSAPILYSAKRVLKRTCSSRLQPRVAWVLRRGKGQAAQHKGMCAGG